MLPGGNLEAENSLFHYFTKKNGWLITTCFLLGKWERQIVGRRGRLHPSLSGSVGPRSRARPPVPAAGPRLAAPAAALRPIRGLAHLASTDKTPDPGWGRVGVRERAISMCQTTVGERVDSVLPRSPLPLCHNSHTLSLFVNHNSERCVVQPTPLEKTAGEGATAAPQGGTSKYTPHFLLHACPIQTVTHTCRLCSYENNVPATVG